LTAREAIVSGKEKLGADDLTGAAADFDAARRTGERAEYLEATSLLARARLAAEAVDDAVAFFREVVAARRVSLDASDAVLLATLNNLAVALRGLGPPGYLEAEQLFREVLHYRTTTLGPAHGLTMATAANLETVRNQQAPT
jgi:hypothetical protein